MPKPMTCFSVKRHEREEETETQYTSHTNRCSIKRYTQDTDIPSYKVLLLCFVLVQSHHREEEAETRNASHKDPEDIRLFWSNPPTLEPATSKQPRCTHTNNWSFILDKVSVRT